MRNFGCNIKEISAKIKTEIKNEVEKVHPAISLNSENHIVVDLEKAKANNNFEARYLVNRALRNIDAWVETNFNDMPELKQGWYQVFGPSNAVVNLLPKNVSSALLFKLDNDARLEEQEISAQYDKELAEKGAKALQDETFGALDLNPDIEYSGNENDPYFNLEDGDDPIGITFDTVPTLIDNIITQKENMLSNFRHRLSKVQSDKNYFKQNKEIFSNLVKEEQYLVDTIEGTKDSIGLIQEIENLKDTSSLGVFILFADNDMVRMQEMMERGTPEDLLEIRKLIEFYQAATTFEAGIDNPIFSQDQMFDNNFDNKLPQEIKDKFQEFRDTMEVIKNKLYSKDVEAIMTTVDNISDRSGIERMSRAEVFSDNGRKDTHWVDSWVMDVTNGILSENGPLAQAMSITLRDTLADYKVRAKQFETRVDDLIGKLDKKLPGLQGLGFKAKSYDIFRAKNKKGQYRDSIAQRYTVDYYRYLSQSKSNFNSNLREAYTEENPTERSKKVGTAYNSYMNTLRENSYAIDISKIQQLAGKNYDNDGGKHEQFLKEQLGEKGFQKELQKQANLIKEFDIQREIFIDDLLVNEGVFTEEELSARGKSSLVQFDLQNNPVVVAQTFYNFNTVKDSQGNIVYQNPKYLNLIPRKIKGEIYFDNSYYVKDTNQELDYFDDNFSAIEADDDLEAFHKILEEFSTEIIGALPPEIKSKFNLNSIPQMRKSIAEILVDPNLTVLQKISQAFKELMDKIRISFGEKVINPFSNAPINVITGKPDYTVNPEKLDGNKQFINERFNVESVFLSKLLGVKTGAKMNELYNQRLRVSSLSPEVRDYFRTQLEPKAFEYLMQQEVIQPYVELREAITHQVISEQSFDLPKIIKFYSHTAMQYQARNKILPLLSVMKEHYESISNVETNSIGQKIINKVKGDNRPKGKRLEAIKQMDSWFNRNALGNYTSSDTLGDTTQKEAEHIAMLNGKLKSVINNKIYTYEEKETKQKITEAIQILENQLEKLPSDRQQERKEVEKKISQLTNQLQYLGRTRSTKAFVTSLYNWIRFMGLGYNLKSQITNFLEGQSSNTIAASSGKYFTPDNIFRANQIAMASFMKNSTFGMIATENAQKTTILTKRYDILQDASSDLQKASSYSAVGGRVVENLKPYTIMGRVEYLNQTAVMNAVLMDQPITGIDGTVSNVFDAMDRNGNLKPNFATKENIDNWVNANGEDFKKFNSHVNKAIIDIHGDYDGLRGSRMTESLLFTPLMMFKRWLPRQLYNRFGVEQQDLETGMSTIRGRYRDHTMTTGVLQGAMYGLIGASTFGMGPIGMLVATAVGGAMVKTMGNQGKIQYQREGMSGMLGMMQESAFIIKEMVLNIARLPINSIAGRALIKAGDYSKFEGKDKVAIMNLRANIAELSMMLAISGLMLMIKGLAYDDEDEEDSPRRQAHNYFVNTFMQMSSSLSQFTNPVDMYKMFESSAATNFLTNLTKFIGSANDFIFNGSDTIPSGPYAGQSGMSLYGSRVAIPSMLKFDSSFGFGTSMQKQFEKSYFDQFFYGEERKAKTEISKIKSKIKVGLNDRDLTNEELDILEKELNRKTRKKKKETYEEALLRVEGLQENGELNFE